MKRFCPQGKSCEQAAHFNHPTEQLDDEIRAMPAAMAFVMVLYKARKALVVYVSVTRFVLKNVPPIFFTSYLSPLTLILIP